MRRRLCPDVSTSESILGYPHNALLYKNEVASNILQMSPLRLSKGGYARAKAVRGVEGSIEIG